LFQLLYHPVASVGIPLTLPQAAEIIEETLISVSQVDESRLAGKSALR
jgi:hypothetical protein